MSDDLTTELRELAESGEVLPVVPGAEIRRRAGARRRRRRTSAAVGGAAAALTLGLALVLNLGGPGAERKPSPAGRPTSTPSTQEAPVATVRLASRILTVDGRTLFVSPGTARRDTPTGRLTVAAKYEVKLVSGEDIGFKGTYSYKVPWMVELRADDGTSVYLGGLSSDEKAPGNYDTTRGWIGLRVVDAKWLYGRLAVGDAVNIEGTASPSDTATPDPAGVDTATTETATGGPAAAGSAPEASVRTSPATVTPSPTARNGT
ncbi:L,D-transpeptidase [Streptomyces avermitilis]|uniref:L,D-transpeptidase n=1 Tax=Streptomyces avermitilis TaxID=33903 RepID=UPI00369CB8C8